MQFSPMGFLLGQPALWGPRATESITAVVVGNSQVVTWCFGCDYSSQAVTPSHPVLAFSVHVVTIFTYLLSPFGLMLQPKESFLIIARVQATEKRGKGAFFLTPNFLGKTKKPTFFFPWLHNGGVLCNRHGSMSHQSARKRTSSANFISWVVCVPIARKVIKQSKFKAFIRTLPWEQAILWTTQAHREGSHCHRLEMLLRSLRRTLALLVYL